MGVPCRALRGSVDDEADRLISPHHFCRDATRQRPKFYWLALAARPQMISPKQRNCAAMPRSSTIFGPPLGKLRLPILSFEMGVNLRTTSGTGAEKRGDLAATPTNPQTTPMYCYDEIHRLSPVGGVNPAMEDYQLTSTPSSGCRRIVS